MKHKLPAAAAVLALAVTAALPAAAAPELDYDSYVNDYADILSRETEDYIFNVSCALGEACGAEIGVYTTDYVGNSTTEAYAYEVFNAWELGDADKDNGVLLLLVPGEDDYYLMRGAGIESQLTINMLSTIAEDDLDPYWERGDYDTAVREAVEDLSERLCRIYGVTLNQSGAAAGPVAGQSGGIGFMGILLVLIAVILVVVVVASLLRPRRRYRSYAPPPPPRRRSSFGSNMFWYGMGRASRPRRGPSPPPPPRRGPRPPRSGGFGGFGGSRPGGFGGFSGSSRPHMGGGIGRSSGRSSGGGRSRGGGIGRR